MIGAAHATDRAHNASCSTVSASPEAGSHIALIAASYAMFSLVVALLVLFFRESLGSPGFFVVLAYWLSAVLPMLAYAAPFVIFRHQRWNEMWSLASFLTALAIVPLAGYWGLSLLLLAAAIGAWSYRRQLTNITPPSAATIASIALAALIFSVTSFLLINSMKYANVFSPERALAGIHNRDQLFHTSIASMFAEYGVAGTGLDGLQPFRYHVLSHIWLGMTAKGFGVNSVFGYFLGMQIVAMPLIYFSITVASAAFVRQGQRQMNPLLLLAAPISMQMMTEYGNWVSYLVSESHIFGLILFLLALPALKRLPSALHLTAAPVLIGIGFVVGMSILLAKASIGIVWFSGFLYICVREPKISPYRIAVLSGPTLFTFWLAARFIIPIEHSENGGIVLFHFLNTHPQAAIANLSPIVLAIGLQAWRYSSMSRTDRIWSEALIIMLFTSALPVFFLKLDGGSAYYFVNVGTWVAVAVIAAHIVSTTTGRYQRVVLAVCTVAILLSVVGQPARKAAWANLERNRNELLKSLAVSDSAKLEDTVAFNRAALAEIATALNATPGARLLGALNAAGVAPGDQRVVFVEPDADQFWSMNSYCAFTSFFVPSVVGVPMIKGLPPSERKCDLGVYYSFATYGPEAASSKLSDSELCIAARQKGFNKVTVVNASLVTRDLNCE